jgi:DNA helicase-2/ATP-dependent DNA helicase PcrA
MSHWQKIRDAAGALRREICKASNLNENELLPAQELLTIAAEYLELDLIPEHPDSGNLSGALAVLEDDCIYFNNHLKKWYKAFCITHEIGHHRLHHTSLHCTQDEIQEFAGDGEAGSGVEKILGYGAGDRREREANLFALELLLPCGVLRRLYLENNLTAKQIAGIVEMPAETVAGQLARALLVPVSEIKTDANNNKEKGELNESQKRAAKTEKCPTLVYAGPGTGKTQTLTERIAHLIKQGIEPKRILALTFSNKAAEEMRERIGKISSEAASQMQVMTFHAYGLDILRTYWVEAELDPRSKLLDKIDALLYLEKKLNFLRLEHYQNLYEPTQNLSAVLGAISRAKDELCSPEEYRSLGEKMLTEAQNAPDNEDLILKAEKVIETAHAYEFYQKYLTQEKLLDFGDLVYRAVRLLQENEAVKAEVRAKYDAILVDEFQDVNRACGVLLKEIAGAGRGLWTVGDLRQSIYRWRGASPTNIELFGVDFPEAETISLEANYRSRTGIVSLFSEFARMMKTSREEVFNSWEAIRGAGTDGSAAVRFEISDSLVTEAANIAGHIANYHELGLNYKDCAVICRTHAQLNKFAKILSEKEIPIFYLGELFERDEVRDLLSLLDLKVTPGGHSLIRVALFPEYRIPLADARKIIAAQKENGQTCAEVLSEQQFFDQLSVEAKPGARKLLNQLTSSAGEVSAWGFLVNYVFNESSFLKTFFAIDDVNNQSKRLAIYQFLRLTQTTEKRFAGKENAPISELLEYVKKLAHFNEDKNYAQIPVEAENLDAVRLLTVHSAKGLEFPVVFTPYLGAGKIPSKAQPQTCPNPDGMITGEIDFHESEEECLFFVAMSRARDHLHLSRASKYGKSNSGESKFLKVLTEFLPLAEQTDSIEVEAAQSSAPEVFPPQVFYSADLDRYMRCGRDYFYTKILGLKSAGDKSIYLKFHGCVYDTIRSMQSIKQMDTIELTQESALTRLDEFWLAAEVDLHPYAPIYKTRAEEIIRRLCRKMENSIAPNEITRPTYELSLSNGIVKVYPDAVEIIETETETTAVIRQYKTGKSPKKIDPDDKDVLMTAAVQNSFPEATPLLQKIYLSDDNVREVPITAKVIKLRLEKYDKAIEGINNRIFEPAPSENNCPYCPHFFICPSGGKMS